MIESIRAIGMSSIYRVSFTRTAFFYVSAFPLRSYDTTLFKVLGTVLSGSGSALRNLGLRGCGHGLFAPSIVRVSVEHNEPALRSLAPSSDYPFFRKIADSLGGRKKITSWII